jgi:hypothetical protein
MRSLFLGCILLLSALCAAPRKAGAACYCAAKSDTSKYAFLQFVKERDHYHFDNNVKAATLTAGEIKKVTELLKIVVGKHAKQSKFNPQSITGYHMQVIAVINTHGEKVVWINCFYSKTSENPKWKTEPVLVLDGGPCYFNLNINLDTGEDSNFMVNGVAWSHLPPPNCLLIIKISTNAPICQGYQA